MIVRVNRLSGFELYECDGIRMRVVGEKNSEVRKGKVDLVEFRLFSLESNQERELVTLEIDENSQVYIMNNAGQTITKYYI